LGETRGAIGGGLEPGVAQPAPAAVRNDKDLVGVDEVFDDLSSVGVTHQRTWWQLNDQRITAFAGAIAPLPTGSILGLVKLLELKMVKGAPLGCRL
jgi:hypothetical protein